MLIGRGRRDWVFDANAQGSVDDVSQNLKGQAGFAPAHYSDAIVNDLISQAGMTFPGDVEVRIMRATSIDGTATYQDSRWTNLGGTAFTFDFDSGISVTHTIMNPGDTPVNEGSYTTATTSTKDNYSQGAGDNGARIFTFSHNSIEGFRYGSAPGVSSSTATDSFLYDTWPAPYTEVYIPYEAPAQSAIFSDLAISNITATAAWPYATAISNLTSLTLVWDIEDKGNTNLLLWTGNSGDMGAQNAGEVTGNATPLTADTEYFFRFYADYTPTNGWSGLGTFATLLTAAQTPTSPSAEGGWASVDLSWQDNANTETGYLIRRSDSGIGGPYVLIDTLDPDTESYTDASGLLEAATYHYQIAATNTANESGTAFASCQTSATLGVMPTTLLGILDLTANGGINPATLMPWKAGDTYRFIFATSTGTAATSTNIAYYNSFVQTLADASPLNIGAAQGVTWNAIASTLNVAANVNTSTDTGTGESIWLLNGTSLVADNYAILYSSVTDSHSSTINKSEILGNPFNGGNYGSIWTGSSPSGGIQANEELGDPDGIAQGGLFGYTGGAHWITRFGLVTTDPYGLYGLSDPITLQGPPIPSGTLIILR